MVIRGRRSLLEFRDRRMDLIEELRLRRWARTHHVSPAERPQEWDPVVLDEMRRKDADCDWGDGAMRDTAATTTMADPLVSDLAPGLAPADEPSVPMRYGYVPLVPDSHLGHITHPAHTRLADPKLLKQIERIAAEGELAGARPAESATAW